jgi:2-amino-4-hydroxy-6-hydroxymethyldihydropteridine diphosphokinase
VSVRAFIGVGSNLGDRAAQCAAAADRLATLPDTTVVRMSPLIETRPAEGVAGGPFLNGVAELATALAPEALLGHLQSIEAALGRPAGHAGGQARPIDLDLLLYGDVILRQPHLIVPHPRLAERRFVLEPLAAIAPEARHPVLRATAADLLQRLGKDPS